MNSEIEGVKIKSLSRHSDQRGWLLELFRQDELPQEYFPVMSYLSLSHAGAIRGPHEHRHQSDLFAFVGPGNFRIYLWDNRPDSKTYGNKTVLDAGQDNPTTIIIPPGVVHAYKNISAGAGYVFNAPNQLFAGENKNEPVDEIRYEDDPNSKFTID